MVKKNRRWGKDLRFIADMLIRINAQFFGAVVFRLRKGYGAFPANYGIGTLEHNFSRTGCFIWSFLCFQRRRQDISLRLRYRNVKVKLE